MTRALAIFMAIPNVDLDDRTRIAGGSIEGRSTAVPLLARRRVSVKAKSRTVRARAADLG
ncbi:hypothetical protein [Rhodococcus kronopolitis]|uniref:Uncharacterized protein n=1 Tax=Rhodococcus kronopolitis TaxID=1460226 RepID=A0ABV9FQJ1_9NOCA